MSGSFKVGRCPAVAIIQREKLPGIKEEERGEIDEDSEMGD
jgi:hypothetical protein